MTLYEAMAFAKEIWADDVAREELGNIVLRSLGDVREPAHPVMDVAEDALDETFDYQDDDGNKLWDDKTIVAQALVALMGRTIKKG